MTSQEFKTLYCFMIEQLRLEPEAARALWQEIRKRLEPRSENTDIKEDH